MATHEDSRFTLYRFDADGLAGCSFRPDPPPGQALAATFVIKTPGPGYLDLAADTLQAHSPYFPHNIGDFSAKDIARFAGEGLDGYRVESADPPGAWITPGRS